QAGVRLTVEPASGSVSGDRKAVASALVSLLENAVQACADGGEVALAVEATEGSVSFVVRDNGRGIPREIQERLFEPF
ncbi:ATP-binding protein, partial [Salmonella enterica subsp. enterica serovar Typhimurium]|nr:ATP-binding protein [Salmonella enterica subsp. enterica serovar Typhimurium]